jgi:hypothetical protein
VNLRSTVSGKYLDHLHDHQLLKEDFTPTFSYQIQADVIYKEPKYIYSDIHCVQ